jgi:hypothetical protein
MEETWESGERGGRVVRAGMHVCTSADDADMMR